MKLSRIKFADAFRVKHGYAFKGQYFDTSGPFVLLTPGSFNETGGIRHQGEKTKFYAGDVPEGYVMDEGDLLVAMTEQAPGLLGSSLLVPEAGRFLHNQRLGRIMDLNEKLLDRRFLYHLFNTRSVRHQISGSASGTKVRHTAPERIGRVEVAVPPVAIQRRVASIITAYDDLIENNRRRMVLLEESARLLYREWFVRLRFPGHESTRIVNGVPKGWSKVPLGDICTDSREMVSPESLEPDTPYIGLEHMPRRSIALSDWGTAEQVTSSKLRFSKGDILFGKIRPYFHKVGIAFTGGVVSSDSFVIRPKTDELKSFVLLTVSSDEFIADTSQSMKEGAKMPRADWKQMVQFPVMFPPSGLLENFSESIQAITDQLNNLCFQNQKLLAARDLLLPKLMSGEIEV